MRFKKFIPALCLACTIGVLVAYRLTSPRNDVKRDHGEAYKVSFLVFNTQADVTVYGADKTAAAEACQDLIGKLTELHLAINAYDKSSELSKLNDTAADQPFICSPLLWDILLKSEEAWKLSNGLFDVTVGPLLALWGFHAKKDLLPTQADIDAVMKRVGFGKLELDRETHSVSFTHKGMRLDFGGIAKGYALQLAIDVMRRHQMKSYLINLGGNIFRTDTPKGVVMGITHPSDTSRLLGTVVLHGQCIATSGNYERFRVIQGKRIAHIMDPRTGWPVTIDTNVRSVTAVTRDPTFSDVFSTTAFVGGIETAQRLVKSHPGTAFVFADTKGTSADTPAGKKLSILIVGDCGFKENTFP